MNKHHEKDFSERHYSGHALDEDFNQDSDLKFKTSSSILHVKRFDIKGRSHPASKVLCGPIDIKMRDETNNKEEDMFKVIHSI